MSKIKWVAILAILAKLFSFLFFIKSEKPQEDPKNRVTSFNGGFFVKNFKTLLESWYPRKGNGLKSRKIPTKLFDTKNERVYLQEGKDYKAVRLGFYFRFKSIKNTTTCEISQLVAEFSTRTIKQQKDNVTSVLINEGELLNITEYSKSGYYDIDSLEDIDNEIEPDTNLIEFDYRSFSTSNLDELKQVYFPDNPTSLGDITTGLGSNATPVNIDQPAYINLTEEPSSFETLEFYNKNLAMVFFPDMDFLLLKSFIDNDNYSTDVFFSGAQTKLGRVVNPISQFELVNNNNGAYPMDSDFTIKAELFPRDFNKTPSDHTINNRNFEQADTTLPLVSIGAPCPKLWFSNSRNLEFVGASFREDPNVKANLIVRQLLPNLQNKSYADILKLKEILVENLKNDNKDMFRLEELDTVTQITDGGSIS